MNFVDGGGDPLVPVRDIQHPHRGSLGAFLKSDTPYILRTLYINRASEYLAPG